MKSALKLSKMSPEELRDYLNENKANGFADLSLQARAFAHEYIECRSHLLAADAAKVPRNKALSLIRHPLVQIFLEYLNGRKSHYSLIDTAFIEVQYLSLYSKLLGEEEIPSVTREGKAIKVKRFHPAESVNALRDMARSIDFFGENKRTLEHVGAGGGPIQTADLTTEVLKEELARLGFGRESNQLSSKLHVSDE